MPEVLVAYISSVIPEQLLASDLILDPAQPEFYNCNLKVVSALRLHKLATIHCSSLMRRLGAIEALHREMVADRIKRLLAL